MIAAAAPSLRPYQLDQVERVRQRIRSGQRRVVLVAVTGSGKTVMACALIQAAVAKGRRVVFLAHRSELIQQASDRLALWGVQHGIIQAGQPGDARPLVQVASVQTLARRLKRQRVSVAPGWDGAAPSVLDHVDLIVVDECHHATASQYRQVLEAFPAAVVVGLTATPYRLDGSGLGDLFDALESGPQVAELVRQGYLVRPVTFAPPAPRDLAELRLRAGEYRQDDADQVMNQTAPIEEIVRSWQRHAAGRITVGFGCTVEHAEHLAAAFRAHALPAAAIDGTTPASERAAILAKLSRGELQLVFNCMLLTEGWDLPACSAVILARPTASRCLWRQMIGRGLRSAEGKADCVILDHVGSVHRFGMPEDDDTYDLDGDGEHVVSQVKTCPHCDAVLQVPTMCGECGWVAPTPREYGERIVLVRKAVELEQAKVLSADDRRELYHSWLSTARDRGFADGWAAHRYRERFGIYPPRGWFDAYEAQELVSA
jgi:DNA repair protein RadD